MAKKVYLSFPVSLIPSLYEKETVKEGMGDMIHYAISVFMEGKGIGLRDALEEMGIMWGVSDSEAIKICEEAVEKGNGLRVFTGLEKERAFKIYNSGISYYY